MLGQFASAQQIVRRRLDLELPLVIIECSGPDPADCGNAAMGSTWATIKREIRHIHGDWSQMTRSQLCTTLFASIETFYNPHRHQARLGHCTPAAVYADHAA